MKLAIVTAMMLFGVISVSAYADHAQVTISLTPDTMEKCTPVESCVNPSTTSLDPNGEIIWSNDGTVTIRVIGGTDENPIDSGVIGPGQTYSLRFPDSGEYTFSVESFSWMTGTIVVSGHDHDDGHSHDHGDDAMEDNMAMEDGYMERDHMHSNVETLLPLGIDISVSIDEHGGVIVSATTQGWTWTPENVNQDNIDGEGHAHIYADGVKINRMYGPNYYLGELDPGSHHIRVTLNMNSHEDVYVNGFPAEATMMVIVPESNEQPISTEPVTGTSSMMISAESYVDTRGGGNNLEMTTEDFVLSPQNVGQAHTLGEGYIVMAINGEYTTRIYEARHHLNALEPGTHTVTLSLYTNDHAPYYWGGEPIETSITITVEDDKADGHDDHDHDHG